MRIPCIYGSYFLRSDRIRPNAFVCRHRSPTYGRGWLVFDDPERILTASRSEDVPHLVQAIDKALEQGRYVAGFLTYEATVALGYERAAEAGTMPLGWFSVHSSPPVFYQELVPSGSANTVIATRPDVSREAYQSMFDEVKRALARGDSYQVNLTYRHRLGKIDDPAGLFAERCGSDPPLFAAYVSDGTWHAMSFSPELFLEREGTAVVMRPMKGTEIATGDSNHDEERADHLRTDPKTLAENLMIVDIVRNDLGSVSEIGSVSVPKLLEVERHRGLLQAVSTVTARTNASLSKLIQATVPVASVTGAPKRMTCGIIDRLETSPRNLYCGIIGIATIDSQCFSVAIRTATYDSSTRTGEYGVGSGVVWDSEATREYEECESKTDRLHRSAPPWALVESIRGDRCKDSDWRSRHLDRMQTSAQTIGIPFDRDWAERLLEEQQTDPTQKVRLLLDVFGRLTTMVGRSSVKEGVLEAVLARRSVVSTDPSLRHKSTNRQAYQEWLDHFPQADEVLLSNERDEATEFARGNVIFRIDGQRVTPSPAEGCLPGVAVRRMLEAGEVVYRTIDLDDLQRAEAVWFVNSVAGIRPVRLWSPEGRLLLADSQYR